MWGFFLLLIYYLRAFTPILALFLLVWFGLAQFLETSAAFDVALVAMAVPSVLFLAAFCSFFFGAYFDLVRGLYSNGLLFSPKQANAVVEDRLVKSFRWMRPGFAKVFGVIP